MSIQNMEEFYEEWNSKHTKEIQNGSIQRNKEMIKFLEKKILQGKEHYYDGEPIMEDSVFDKCEEFLRILDPGNDVLRKVGKSLK